MGVCICPTHGRKYLAFVCPHIRAAVTAGSPCPGIQSLTYTAVETPELGKLKLPCWFCPQCIRDHSLPPDGTAVSEDFLVAISKLYRPMCPDCFKDWQARGLG